MSETNIESYILELADQIEVQELDFDEEIIFSESWFSDQDDSLFGE